MNPMIVALRKIYQYRNGIQNGILHVTYNWFLYGVIQNIHKVTCTYDTLLISIRQWYMKCHMTKVPNLPNIHYLQGIVMMTWSFGCKNQGPVQPMAPPAL